MKMTTDELKIKFPRASESFLRANTEAGHAGSVGDNPVVQDAEVRDRLAGQKDGQDICKADDTGRTQKMDGKDRAKFRITVSFRYPDYRTHDNDGGYSTICDCLIAARRQLEVLAGNRPEKRTVRAGGNRRDNHNREALKKPLPF